MNGSRLPRRVSDTDLSYRGVVWSASDLTNPIRVGVIGRDDSSAYDVSNSGVAVGTADSGGTAFRWDATNGIAALQSYVDGAANAVTDDASLIVGDTLNASGKLQASVWSSSGQSFLDDPNGIGSFAWDVSPNGNFIGGKVDYFDPLTFTFGKQAALWDANGNVTLLTDADGNRFTGEVLGVTDNGWTVGTTSDNHGFISNPDDGYAQIFDAWIVDQGGDSLPTPSQSVNAIVENPQTHQLVFAVHGSAYVVGVRHARHR